MKRTLAVATVFAIILGTWLMLQREERTAIEPRPEAVTSADRPVARAESAKTQTAPVHSAQNANRRAGVPTLSGNFKADRPRASATKPSGNQIEFQVINGYAVAYGDMLLGKPTDAVPNGRGFYDSPTPQLWESAEIPYAINPELPNPERIEKALAYLRANTPVNFVPYQDQPDAIIFESTAENCLSPLGRQGGLQPILLASQCQSQEIMHEILHALGFVHEQSRGDRDSYVEIVWDNIDEKYHDQFALVPDSFLEAVRGFPFDYRSIMLYRPNTFAMNRELPSMKSRRSEPINPMHEGLSEFDIKRLNRMFRGYE